MDNSSENSKTTRNENQSIYTSLSSYLQRLTLKKEQKGTSAVTSNPAMAMRERIVRRAALEFHHGMYANLGIGMPMLASNYIPEGEL